eukprot:TRINITY_DN5971_c0_g1_i1.p1 TRINITY_DN5971_c0_g1~~TRINITY_DN5971_c0_g1_i1.p1  ORF type:complete len:198 (-),score=73.55 TRINITY_DN5971_c0_g1_i1:77-670(-)
MDNIGTPSSAEELLQESMTHTLQQNPQLGHPEMSGAVASPSVTSSLLNSNPSLPASPLVGGGGESLPNTAGCEGSLPQATPEFIKPSETTQVLDRKRLQQLVKEVDPNEQLDEDVEELLLHIADDFIEQTVSATCALAKHRKAPTIEVRDVQFILERNWNMWIPGFGTEEVRPYKKSSMAEAHRSRMALIKKTLKKY